MQKPLIRIVSLLLIPCLLGDPLLAATAEISSLEPVKQSQSVNQSDFQEQALTPVILWTRSALEHVRSAPRVRVMATAALAASTVALAAGHSHISVDTPWQRMAILAVFASLAWLSKQTGLQFILFGLVAMGPDEVNPTIE